MNEATATNEQEKWNAEAKRLNDLVVELTPPRRSPGKELDSDTPLEVLAVLLAQQETHLGGVAKPARGCLQGTFVNPHGRLPLRDLNPWQVLQGYAREYVAGHPGEEFPAYLENRRAKRTWAKLNPFRVKKVRIKNRNVVVDLAAE